MSAPTVTGSSDRAALAAQLEDLTVRRRRLAGERAPLAQNIAAAREAGDAGALAVLQPQLAALDTIIGDVDREREAVADRLAAIDREAAVVAQRRQIGNDYEDAVYLQRDQVAALLSAIEPAVRQIREAVQRVRDEHIAAVKATDAVTSARAAAVRFLGLHQSAIWSDSGFPQLRTVIAVEEKPAEVPKLSIEFLARYDRDLAGILALLVMDPLERERRIRAGQLPTL